ncbi:unnamed protein product [Brassicogethes aeneus]|uniref:Uncharacterized protein n=1 Tax=Brassicogethes aeneus TaxID=1431903 RepID=A0A9P0BHM3_BRAAE|nr:unnamed protein product [Brassicogethes aeneus]
MKKKIIKATHDGTEEDIFEKCLDIKRETEEDENIAFHQIQYLDTGRLKKMLEAIFHGTNTVATIYTPKNTPAERRPKERRTYAVVVENKGKSYEDTLKKVKAALIEKSQEGIRNIRSTKDGNILITTDKDQSVIDNIKKTIQERNMLEEGKIIKLGKKENKEVIFIRGMDADTTKEEMEGKTDHEGNIQEICDNNVSDGEFNEPFMPSEDENDPEYQPPVLKQSRKRSMLDYFHTKGKKRLNTAIVLRSPSPLEDLQYDSHTSISISTIIPSSSLSSSSYSQKDSDSPFSKSTPTRASTPLLLDGKFFQVVERSTSSSQVKAQCQICLPSVKYFKENDSEQYKAEDEALLFHEEEEDVFVPTDIEENTVKGDKELIQPSLPNHYRCVSHT